MTKEAKRDQALRVGVYSSARRADAAIDGLLAAGFQPERITVVCTRETDRDHFREYLHQDPAGRSAPAAALAGGAVGVALAGVVVFGAAALVGSPLIFAIGGTSIWTGGVLGSLVGAMMSRGFDKELADFYQQAVQDGKLLVAVDLAPESAHRAELAVAERVLAAAGAEPLALSES